MKRILNRFILAVLLFSSASAVAQEQEQSKPLDYVSTLVGTSSKYELSTGNTYPAIARPWGMNFWVPQTGKMGDGWIYTYTADKIRGFKQTHQPSPWMNDYGQFSLMPVTNLSAFDEESRASWFSHKAEIAKPHYYSVYLADHDVTTEITPTSRAAIFRFTFPESKESAIVIDAFDKGSYIQIIPGERKIVGYTTKNSGGVPENFKNYFVIQFDKPFYTANLYNQHKTQGLKLNLQGEHIEAVLKFQTKRGEQITARVASSFISEEQAALNLKEVASKKFDDVVQEGEAEWNNTLSKIQVQDTDVERLKTFYSCLYRAVLFPRSFYEIDAQGRVMHYSPYNGQVLPGYMFTDTGFWDTFRSLFPLLNLVYPSMNEKMQEGLVHAYKESGFLPEWASPGHRNIMIGNNSASVVADAYLKGLSGYDIEQLWKAVIHGANSVHPQVPASGRTGFEAYNSMGYIPNDIEISQNVARTLEYAFNDWSIYQLGLKLNKPASEIDIYAQRAMNYKNVFDPSFNLMRGKSKSGKFISDFKPTDWSRDFTEGNSLHYSWSVLHDVQGLIDLMGGAKTFNTMLDTVFQIPGAEGMKSRSMIHEMREMQVMNMGQYAHGNQPIQHMPYLYNYAGQPWKAQYWVRTIMDKLYTAAPDGYCGDEDNGQTSAWYVFSALGFYPVTPGSDEYIIGSPLFKEVTIHLENGNNIHLSSEDNSRKAVYISDILWNDQPYSKNFFRYEDLLQGAHIQFKMSTQPNLQRGISAQDRPYSFSNR